MGSPWVQSGQVQKAGKISASGRVKISVGQVGSGPKIWTHVQLCLIQLKPRLFKFVVDPQQIDTSGV